MSVTGNVEFSARPGAIEGLVVVTMKQVGDERGTVRELFRRSAFEREGCGLSPFAQINVTESRHGAVRGLHAENMTKLLTLLTGEALGVYFDLRRESPTFRRVETVELRPGVQVLLPNGVANGFQTVSETSQYAYCFDREWAPGMDGQAITPLDPALEHLWPIPINPDDTSQISQKDRSAPSLAELLS